MKVIQVFNILNIRFVYDKYYNTWFYCIDIAKLFGYNKASDTMRRNIKSENKIHLYSFLKKFGKNVKLQVPSTNLKIVLINTDGLISLIKNGRKFTKKIKIELINFIKETCNIKYEFEENEYISIIENIFYKYDFINNYDVLNYNINLYFIELKIAIILVDNNQDIENENEIINALKCNILKINTNDVNFSICNTIGDIIEIITKI